MPLLNFDVGNDCMGLKKKKKKIISILTFGSASVAIRFFSSPSVFTRLEKKNTKKTTYGTRLPGVAITLPDLIFNV